MNVMVIPAAGRGTRLSFDGPKLLYPLAGKTLLAYLAERYAPHIDLFIVVINPNAEKEVRQELESIAQKNEIDYRIDFQHKATGMLDAITIPMQNLQQQYGEIENVWISWCDQVSITATTADTLASKLASLTTKDGVYMALPTVQVSEPYIHMQRNNLGMITDVLQRRENDKMPQIGENDCGLFAMSKAAYFNELREFSAIDQIMGSETFERNFLPFIAWLSQRATVTTFAAASEIETLGINTVTDAQRLLNVWREA